MVPWLGGALILLACVLAYAPVLHGKFLWDDLYLVGANPLFKSPRFLVEVFRHYLFLDSFSLYYRPVQNLSYILDYAIWNRKEFGYHLSNILFHAASAFLLVLVIRRCLQSMPREGRSPLFEELPHSRSACLWAVHPIHNAAVAYVSGRADSIAMMFALAGWLLFFNESAGWRGAATRRLPFSVCSRALCAKEIAFIWIALFAIYLFGFERGMPLRSKLGTVGSLLGIFAIYLWLRHLPGSRPVQQGVTIHRLPTEFSSCSGPWAITPASSFTRQSPHGTFSLECTPIAPWPHGRKISGRIPLAFGLLTIAAFVYACRSPLPGRKFAFSASAGSP